MSNTVSRLDLTQILCDVDDFYQSFLKNKDKSQLLVSEEQLKPCYSRLCVSEVMAIVIAFHGSGYRTFKEYYLHQVLKYWRRELPNLVSYNRFVELMPGSLLLKSLFSHYSYGRNHTNPFY